MEASRRRLDTSRVIAVAGIAAVAVAIGAVRLFSHRQPAPVAAAIVTTTTPNSVSIDNFSFNPSELSVAAGDTVTWTNRDDVPHTVTSDSKLFTSAALDTDQTYTHQFLTPGVYPYFCQVHPHMTGKIIVR